LFGIVNSLYWVRWSAGALERWSAGALERWSAGALERWSVNQMNKLKRKI
jgi:hypothetical protein